MLRTSLALALVLSLAACKGSSSSSSASGPSGGTTSTAEVRWPDAGGPSLAIGERVVALPSGELAAAAHPAVMQDEPTSRFAFVRAAGDVRYVYVVGKNAYLGPVAKAPIDFHAAPDLDHALGALFELAAERRPQLVADVLAQKSDAGLARMLIDGAGADGREWDDAFAKLPEPRAAEVKTALTSLLERGKPTAGLKRAVVLAPLREPSRAPALAARIKELSDPVREPRATAVMLRALAATDKAQAAPLACEVIAKKPEDDALVEAALLVVAAAGSECPHVAAQLGEDACLPQFRCSESGPLSGRETTKQDEPLCTKEQLAAAIEKDLQRTPADVIAGASGTRPHLFAFASLLASGKLPPAFVTAHTRRRYAVAQPKEPECESGVAIGTACHCEEAILRDQACRHPEGTTVSVGVCKFEIDDKQKKLTAVVATSPP